MLMRLFYSAGAWAAIGLLSGLYWREMTKGTLQVLGVDFAESPALSGFHGLGHMIVAGTLLYYFLQLRRAVRDSGPISFAAAPRTAATTVEQ